MKYQFYFYFMNLSSWWNVEVHILDDLKLVFHRGCVQCLPCALWQISAPHQFCILMSVVYLFMFSSSLRALPAGSNVRVAPWLGYRLSATNSLLQCRPCIRPSPPRLFHSSWARRGPETLAPQTQIYYWYHLQLLCMLTHTCYSDTPIKHLVPNTGPGCLDWTFEPVQPPRDRSSCFFVLVFGYNIIEQLRNPYKYPILIQLLWTIKYLVPNTGSGCLDWTFEPVQPPRDLSSCFSFLVFCFNMNN